MLNSTPVTLKGTLGRVYGGDDEKVHIADGTRGSFGATVADFIDREMRARDPDAEDKPLCPGCYMIALVAAAMHLAQRNGQSLVELGRTMAYAFEGVADLAERAEGPVTPSEEILITPFVQPVVTPAPVHVA